MTVVALVDLLLVHSLTLLAVLARASVEGAIVGGLAWGVCRLTPALPAAVRAWLWWLVALKLLVGLLPLPAVQLAWLPSTTPVWTSPAATERAPLPLARETRPPSAAGAEAVPAAAARVSVEAPAATVTIPYVSFWPVALCGFWLAIVALQAAALLRALSAARRLVRHAEPAAWTIGRRLSHLVPQFGLPVTPTVLASRTSAAPVLTGVLRPAIILPARIADTLTRQELDLVLGHELAHVRRGDLVWGWVPALAVRLFFFHPLARLATREYLAAREEACDAEVLQTLDAAPADYGQLLVKLGVAPIDDVLAAAGTSPTFVSLKRRLIMLDRSRVPASRWWWTLAGGAAALLPLTLVAQPVTGAMAMTAPDRPTVSAQADLAWRQLPVPPAPPVAPAPPEPPPAVPEVAAEGEAPLPPAPPAPPAPPKPPAPPSNSAQHVRDEGRGLESPWVLLEPGSRNLMAGSSKDRAEAERNRTSDADTLLWFRYRGTAYITRDAATIAALRQAFEPVHAAGKKMGVLGHKQGEVGAKQGELGAKQGELGARQAAIAADMARMVAEQLSANVGRRRDGEGTAADAERVRALDAKRSELEKQMRALDNEQRALGDQMRAMGETLRVEGEGLKEMGLSLKSELAAAETKATAIFGAAVANGTATTAK